jgi:3,2-trans-enoyl-CoA isomerase
MLKSVSSLKFIHSNSNLLLKRGIVISTQCGKKGNIVRLSMTSPPVNSLDLALIKDIKKGVVEAENLNSCKGIIISSSMKAYCAGLNLNEISGKSNEFLNDFWNTFQDMLFSIYGSKKAIIAEITGHAPAGGCMIAMCCDSRIASSNSKIGLNEAAFGLVPPYFAVDMMDDIIGKGKSYKASSLGIMFSSNDALQFGLYDKVIEPNADPDFDMTIAVQEAAIIECEKWIAAPGREHTKIGVMRAERLEKWNKNISKESQTFVDRVSTPNTQLFIKNYLESLSSKKK